MVHLFFAPLLFGAEGLVVVVEIAGTGRGALLLPCLTPHLHRGRRRDTAPLIFRASGLGEAPLLTSCALPGEKPTFRTAEARHAFPAGVFLLSRSAHGAPHNARVLRNGRRLRGEGGCVP